MLVGSLEKIVSSVDLKLLLFFIRLCCEVFRFSCFFFGGVEINVLQVVISEVLLFFNPFFISIWEDGVLPTGNWLLCQRIWQSLEKLRKMLQLEEQLFLQIKNPPTFFWLKGNFICVSSWHSASFVEALSKLAEVVVYLILQVWAVPCEHIKRANLVQVSSFFGGARGVDILPLFVCSMGSHRNRFFLRESFHVM